MCNDTPVGSRCFTRGGRQAAARPAVRPPSCAAAVCGPGCTCLLLTATRMPASVLALIQGGQAGTWCDDCGKSMSGWSNNQQVEPGPQNAPAPRLRAGAFGWEERTGLVLSSVRLRRRGPAPSPECGGHPRRPRCAHPAVSASRPCRVRQTAGSHTVKRGAAGRRRRGRPRRRVRQGGATLRAAMRCGVPRRAGPTPVSPGIGPPVGRSPLRFARCVANRARAVP